MTRKKEPEYTICDMSGDECRYLSGFTAYGPKLVTKPVVFTRKQAIQLLARARNAGWLIDDYEMIRY